jgi:hypothetical protein
LRAADISLSHARGGLERFFLTHDESGRAAAWLTGRVDELDEPAIGCRALGDEPALSRVGLAVFALRRVDVTPAVATGAARIEVRFA